MAFLFEIAGVSAGPGKAVEKEVNRMARA